MRQYRQKVGEQLKPYVEENDGGEPQVGGPHWSDIVLQRQVWVISR